jgi:hypothetical protein
VTARSFDDLEAAHARLVELERRAAGRPAPRRRMPVARVAAFFGSFAALLAIAGFVVVSLHPRGGTIHVAGAAPEAPQPILDRTLAYAPGPELRPRGPSMIDLDGDGVKELVVLGWRRGHPDAPLWVVALERKTYSARWHAGPFVAGWRDYRVRLGLGHEGRLVVVDAAGAHAIDRVTGASTGALLASDERLGLERCPADGSFACNEPTTEAETSHLPRRFREAYYLFDLWTTKHDARVTIVSPDVGSIVAVGWKPPEDGSGADRDTGVAWGASLAGPGRREDPDPLPSADAWTVLDDDRLLHLYHEKSAVYRLAARRAYDGALLYDVVLPPIPDGSAIDGVSADAGELFVVANESILVVDAASGAITRRIDRF